MEIEFARTLAHLSAGLVPAEVYPGNAMRLAAVHAFVPDTAWNPHAQRGTYTQDGTNPCATRENLISTDKDNWGLRAVARGEKWLKFRWTMEPPAGMSKIRTLTARGKIHFFHSGRRGMLIVPRM